MLRKEDLSIIIVDDLQFSCEVIKSGLKKAGYKDIRTANSANEAMLLINRKRPDVIVADFWMPEMNGLEMTDLIRRWDENNNRYTGIILLTAEDTTSSIVVAFDRGVDDFLSKSANLYELAARVYGTGRAARLQNEIRQKNRDLTNHFQHHNKISLTDIDTGLANRKQLEISFTSMIEHCKTRGGGVGLCLIRVNTEEGQNLEDSSVISNIRKGTLRTISNSLKLVLRPMDQIVRYDDCTFAIALVYADQQTFNTDMFKRSTNSILKHTNQFTDQGKKLRLSISIWYSDQFDPLPDISKILHAAEENFKSI
ncbi:MAG: response regulator [Gammaproteobacteria bacterium]|jgi:PleD family two-component response regulator|nr:response regulator [Gammaproteobacteria bacterium]